MEFLAETTLWSAYVGLLIFLGLLALVGLALFGFTVYVAFREGVSVGGAVISVLAALLISIISAVIIQTVNGGPDVEYTVLITDYNEVFAQGYEIVRQEGSLTVLKKLGGR